MKTTRTIPLYFAAALATPALAQAPERDGLDHLSPDRRATHAAYEDALVSAADPASLRAWHDLLAAEPHRAGTQGDHAVIAKLGAAFTDMGLDVETFWFDAYLPHPGSAQLQIIAPDRINLTVAEPAIPQDPYSQKQDAWLGWNGYSGSGDVTAQVVYANHARLEDFNTLRELGIDCTGKVVIARYGGNYRGYKAKYAEQAGAIGLIIYTDPRDSGYEKGLPYPEGGYANEHYIQRGSIMTLGYQGDPLTPGEPAIEGCNRLDPDDVALPRIPVQPIGWGAAQQILERMTGAEVPDESWQGGLPHRYRLEGGDDLRVRLKVEQERRITRTANVLATLKGARFPDQKIIIGCHHDAWLHGAADPLAGMICVMESARIFAQQAAAGNRPDRSIVFAAWGAEELGIVGSSEWVEANRDDLATNAVAYINLDMAAMGPNLGASSWPALKQLIIDASKVIPQARDEDLTAHDLWLARSGRGATEPRVGTLGGGSDHVGFLCHAGVPSISIGAYGSRGTSYHSAYDNLHWYRQVVGDDYAPALMVTRMTSIVAARLANADTSPFDEARVLADFLIHLSEVEARAEDIMGESALPPLTQLRTRAEQALADLNPSAFTALGPAGACTLWCPGDWSQGLTGRPWFRNLFIAPDETSGYAAWPLPELRHAVEQKDPALIEQAVARYKRVLDAYADPVE